MSKTIVIPQMNMRKKITISLISLIGVALLVYEILFYFSSSKKDFNIEIVSLIRLSAIILFVVIPLILLIARKISFSTFFYCFGFLAGFDLAMIGLKSHFDNQSQIELISLFLVGGI